MKFTRLTNILSHSLGITPEELVYQVDAWTPLMEQGYELDTTDFDTLVRELRKVDNTISRHALIDAVNADLTKLSLATIYRFTCKEEHAKFSLGDVVRCVEDTDFVLRSGCCMYETAIVLSVVPFVLVSVSGDMRWSATIRPEYFTFFRKSTPEEFSNVSHRLRQ